MLDFNTNLTTNTSSSKISSCTLNTVDDYSKAIDYLKIITPSTSSTSNTNSSSTTTCNEFGVDKRIKFSPHGLAFPSADNTYVSYVDENYLDVTGKTFDIPNVVYRIPVTVENLTNNDFIYYDNNYYAIEAIESDLGILDVLDLSTLEEKVLRIKKDFDGNDYYYTKIWSPIGSNFASDKVDDKMLMLILALSNQNGKNDMLIPMIMELFYSDKKKEK